MSPRRSAGVLLHPTSLPGDGPIGTLGPDAYRFVDLLARLGATRWQILPLGPVRAEGSPYNAESSFAGNELLIAPELLREDGLLPGDWRPVAMPADPGKVDFGGASAAAVAMLRAAYERLSPAQAELVAAYRAGQVEWLEDFALYRAIKRVQGGNAWTDWPEGLRRREEAALRDARSDLASEIVFECFTQWCFDSQWARLHEYANGHGVRIVGDIPIFPAADSADVWASQHLFKLDDDGRPEVETGVPPDYFSETGQLWGNPHYDWPRHAAEGFAWWNKRVAQTLRRVDIARVDHFRAFAAAWEVPAGAPDARGGTWQPGPGIAIFEGLGLVGSEAIIAEDLGIITDDVRELLRATRLPGMKVLQFAFDSGASNEHLPHNHVARSVVYTGTHDNATTAAWVAGLTPEARRHVADYLGGGEAGILDGMVRAALASVADTAVVPLQDIARLGAEARMNTPSAADGNWDWRFTWDMLDEARLDGFAHLVKLYGRARNP